MSVKAEVIGVSTHAAVAAKTSCRCALVNILKAREKKRVNNKTMTIFISPLSCCWNSTTVGAMRRATANIVMMRRTKVSIRLFEYLPSRELFSRIVTLFGTLTSEQAYHLC